MPAFSKRSFEDELMDDLNCSGEVVQQTLRELETINRVLGGNFVTIDGLRRLLEGSSKSVVSVADLGCGGGDILRLIRKWGETRNLSLQLIGIDANRNIVKFARSQTPPSLNIAFEDVDIFSDAFAKKQFDVAAATLFFHHFNDDELVLLFRQLKKQCRIGFVINDIHRHWFAYYSIKGLTRLFSKSPMVKFDAPLSVLRAFKRKELQDILGKAGIHQYSLRWMWAFRWQIVVFTNET